jgi:hypothetical protein
VGEFIRESGATLERMARNEMALGEAVRRRQTRVAELEADVQQLQEWNAAEHEFLLQTEAERERLVAVATELDDSIKEMEVERENLRKARDFAISCHDTQVIDKATIAGWLAKAEAERAAIEAATIERCAIAADRFAATMTSEQARAVARLIATRIRALAKPPEKEED